MHHTIKFYQISSWLHISAKKLAQTHVSCVVEDIIQDLSLLRLRDCLNGQHGESFTHDVVGITVTVFLDVAPSASVGRSLPSPSILVMSREVPPINSSSLFNDSAAF